MRAEMTLGRVAGIELKVHASFGLVLALSAWQWSDYGSRGALFGAVLSLFVFVCVTLHELGHSVVAQAFGIEVKDITLYPIGGVARLSRRPKTPGQELLIAVAGPLVNVVLAAFFVAGGLWLFGAEALWAGLKVTAQAPPTGVSLWSFLALSNAGLAVFNLLPALPMDGGRVLRAMLSWAVPAHRATLYASWVARVLAVGLFAFGLSVGSPMLPIIAIFVFFASGAEVRESVATKLLEGVRVGDALNPQQPHFAPTLLVAEATQALVWWPSAAFAVEYMGRLVGVVSRDALVWAAAHAGPLEYVVSLADRKPPRVGVRASLAEAAAAMSEAGLPYVAVVADDETFLGLLTEVEVSQQLVVLEALAQRRGEGRRRALPR